MSTTEHDDLTALAGQVDRTSSSIFGALIIWLKQLDAKVAALAAEIANLARDDDSAIVARLTAVEALAVSNAAAIADLIAQIESLIPGDATQLSIIIQTGGPMSGASISIDDTTGAASVAWADDHGDVAAVPTGNDGNPVAVAFSVDNTAVATIDAVSGVIGRAGRVLRRRRPGGLAGPQRLAVIRLPLPGAIHTPEGAPAEYPHVSNTR